MAQHEIEFPRNIHNVLAWADDLGLWVNAGWTVGIPKAEAVEYAASYNSSPNRGFYEHDGKVVLSHGPAKMNLSAQESRAVIDLIHAAYGA
jgi:hypothetical protein